jgi:hypothetical protein
VRHVQLIRNGLYAFDGTTTDGARTSSAEAGMRILCHTGSGDAHVTAFNLTAANNYGPGFFSSECGVTLTDSILLGNGNHADDYAVAVTDAEDHTQEIRRLNITGGRGGVWVHDVIRLSLTDVDVRRTYGGRAALFIEVYSYSSPDITVYGNTFENNTLASNGAVMHLDFAWSVHSSRRGTIKVEANDIYSNRLGLAVVRWITTTTWPRSQYEDVRFVGNRVLGNRLSDVRAGAVRAEGYGGKLQYNFFVNDEQLSEITTAIVCTTCREVDARENWWGTTDNVTVRSRVLDSEDDSMLPTIVTMPFLKSAEFDCSEVNNCSSRGECSQPQRCSCDSGKRMKSDAWLASKADTTS